MATALKFFHYTKGLVNRDIFCANHQELDDYVKQRMSQFEENNLARNYVGLNENGECVSVFCLLSSTLRSEDLIKPEIKYPKEIELPTIKIGRLAVDEKHRGDGIGKLTLAKAISIFVEISKMTGAIGLTVDAKDEEILVDGMERKVYEFYEKYGFRHLSRKTDKGYFPMILYTNTIQRMYPSLFQTPI